VLIYFLFDIFEPDAIASSDSVHIYLLKVCYIVCTRSYMSYISRISDICKGHNISLKNAVTNRDSGLDGVI